VNVPIKKKRGKRAKRWQKRGGEVNWAWTSAVGGAYPLHLLLKNRHLDAGRIEGNSLRDEKITEKGLTLHSEAGRNLRARQIPSSI